MVIFGKKSLDIKQKHIVYLKNIVEDPDATFAEIGKRDTVRAVNQINIQHVRVVLKISTNTNILGYKNSVITGQLISEKRIEKALKKKRITLIYKSDK